MNTLVCTPRRSTTFIHPHHENSVLTNRHRVPVVGTDRRLYQFGGDEKQLGQFFFKGVGMWELNYVVHARHLTHAGGRAE